MIQSKSISEFSFVKTFRFPLAYSIYKFILKTKNKHENY